MIASIAGDIIGSVHERGFIKTTDFELFQQNSSFTDDTVHTLAVAEALMDRKDYGECLRRWSRNYINRGYGGMMRKWIASDDMGPYNSFGNGSAMRVSPVGFAYHRLDQVLEEAKNSAMPTHNHPEGVRGAQAIAACIFWARKGKSKAEIRQLATDTFGYDLSSSVEKLRPSYQFEVTCQKSVPESIICFLDSTDVESAIRLAVSMGGDTDTMACMAGGIAQAFYKTVPKSILEKTEEILGPELWDFVLRFCRKYEVNFQ